MQLDGEAGKKMSRENGNAIVKVTAEGPFVKGARLAARVVSALLLLIICVFAVYEGVPNPFQMTPREWACDGGFALVFLGLILGWRFEWLGGLMVLAGFAVFMFANYPITGVFWPGRSIVFPVVGVLFLLARRKRLLSSIG